MSTNYIFIGNPGNGKSTLLNILCNKNVFKAGHSVGKGLTTTHKKYSIGDITYMDTPGLNDADDCLRKQASAEISKALKSGGDYKVIFVVGEKNGRVLAADAATMNMVLDAAPEIVKNKFGVIVNQASVKTVDLPPTGVGSQVAWSAFLFSQRPDVSTGYLLFLPRIAELEEVQSEKMNFGQVRGLQKIILLMKFVNECPVINLTVPKVTEIDHRQIDVYAARSKKKEEELKKNRALLDELERQLEADRRQWETEMGVVQQIGASVLSGNYEIEWSGWVPTGMVVRLGR